MNKNISLSKLWLKKSISSIKNKIFVIVNIVLIYSVGIVVMSIALNFLKYKEFHIQKNNYFHQITFNTDDQNLMQEDYMYKRVIYCTNYRAVEIRSENIESINLQVAFVESDNDSVLLPSDINSGFHLIGGEAKGVNEIILLYNYASLLSEYLKIELNDLIGENIYFDDDGTKIELMIVGICDYYGSSIMNYLNNYGAISNHALKVNASFYNVTYEYKNLETVQYIYEKYLERKIIVQEYIDNINSIITYTNFFLIIFIFISIILISTSYALIRSSTNVTFLDSLPFLSILKIIGIKDKKIARFIHFETLILSFTGFIIATLFSYLIEIVINSLVDVDALFGNVNFNFIMINAYAIILCAFISLFFSMIIILVQYYKVKNIDVNNKHLYELED